MAWKNQQEATLSLGFSRQNGFNVLLFKFIPIQWLSSLACAEMHIKELANVNVHTAFEVDFAFSIIFTVTYNFCLRCLSE